MSNSNENPDDADTPSEREQLPPVADFDCPENAPVESYKRDLDSRPAMAKAYDFAAMRDADMRGHLDGATDDGLSAVMLTGAFRFVTPCHTAEVGLRASKICAACHGNLDKPVETAMPLVCGHYCVVTHSTGDRIISCPTCAEPSLVRAEQVITTRYLAREVPKAEQLRLMGLQAP